MMFAPCGTDTIGTEVFASMSHMASAFAAEMDVKTRCVSSIQPSGFPGTTGWDGPSVVAKTTAPGPLAAGC